MLNSTFSETSYAWTILTTTAGISDFNAGLWTINTTGFEPAFAGVFSLDQVGNNLVLTYTAIPEPSSFAALLGLGVLGWVAGGRRRRQV